MKACILHGINDLRYEDMPIPELKEDEVLIKVRAAGICGSDVGRVYAEGAYHFPIVIGHEFAGEIVKANPGDEELIGRKVAVFPLIPCNRCSACQIGQYPQCEHYDYYGSRRDGGFSEYIAVKKWNLVFVPKDVPYEHAAMCEPCAVGVHAIDQFGISLGDIVVIFGAGTIGLITAQIAMTCGAKHVVLVDIDQKKLDLAIDMGFTHIVNSQKQELVEYINNLTGGKGADLVIEGAGVSVSVENAIRTAKTFGKIVFLGNPASDIKISQKVYWQILRKQLQIKGTWNSSYNLYKNDWIRAVESIKAGRLQLEKLITHKFSFSECNKAFELIKYGNELCVKVMFINK